MEAADSALFAAIKSRMDPDAEKMIPVDISSGIELMEALTAVCSPTLSEMTVISLTGQLQNPRRRNTETPKEYLYRLQNLQQQQLYHQNIKVDISPLAFVKGIVVSNQFLKDETIAYKREVDHLQTYGNWPQTWHTLKGQPIEFSDAN